MALFHYAVKALLDWALYSTRFRSFSITAEFFIVPPQCGQGRCITVATASSLSFFDPLVSSNLTRLQLDYRSQRGFQHNSQMKEQQQSQYRSMGAAAVFLKLVNYR